eukprot:Pgem_evm1s4856
MFLHLQKCEKKYRNSKSEKSAQTHFLDLHFTAQDVYKRRIFISEKAADVNLKSAGKYAGYAQS